MKLGFVSAILPELTLKEVVSFASAEGFECVELMCWPRGKAERRYAGVTHLDVADFDADDAARVNELMASAGVSISGLGYYPNPLSPDANEAQVVTEHLKKVMAAAALLGVNLVNTFIGRDWTRSVEENWPRFVEVWRPLMRYAEDLGVRVAIEHCPMLFTRDEWPGGKNLPYCPALWRRMFEDIPSENLGLNYDPSHMIWQMMDYVRPIHEFGDRIFHFHAQDLRLDRDKLNDLGILAYPLAYYTRKIVGLGDVNWAQLFSALTDTGYNGPVCIESEDRSFEGSLERRKAALIQGGRYLRQYLI